MAKFNIISQFLKDISFESPNVPELFFKSDNGQAKLEINIDIQIKGAENNLFMVDLITKVHSKLEAGDTLTMRYDKNGDLLTYKLASIYISFDI